jgi:DNA replication licensing factor MCM7
MRTRDRVKASVSGGRSTLTPRQLLSILRMSQALARLEMSVQVNQTHVDEAIRLITISKASVMETDSVERIVDNDYISRLWTLMRDRAHADNTTYITLNDAENLAANAGFSVAQLNEMLTEYRSLHLIQFNATRTRFEFLLGE